MTQGLFGETTIRVRYAETDQMGVVYHSNYLVWFEVGRVELMRQLGLDYKSLERDHGCAIAVVEANLRYRSPARYDDQLTVRTRLASMRGSVLSFAYGVHRGQKVLCEGSTTHVVVGRDMKRAAMPEAYAAVFRGQQLPFEAHADTLA